ncbi:MAG TPA: acetylxylan esterase, partial [Opitutus sp.]|nr:acetylxylan esterase [Opitutus sp.]
YRPGETPTFRIEVLADNHPIADAAVTYAIAPDMTPGEKRTARVPAGGLVVEGGTMDQPGFLRCTATAEVAGKTYRGVATAAFAPEKIVPLQTEPEDFDAFWRGQLATLAKTPLEPLVTFLPEASTDQVNVYHVGIRTIGPSWMKTPARVFGILCEPKAPGKYPAVLKVPGAGVRPYPGDKDLAARGVVVLEIGIHGIPVNLPPQVYDVLYAGALNGYWTFNADNRETFYYNRVFLGCVRANDFIASRENWDGKNLVVMGASQGGQLAIATAALDPRVTGLLATHPAGSDVAADLHGRAGGWPHPFRRDPTTGEPPADATPAKISTWQYYDTVNFARRVKVPGYYTWGYNDEVTPPTSVYAAYNVINAPRTLGLTLEMGHSYNEEQWAAGNAWLGNFLGLK